MTYTYEHQFCDVKRVLQVLLPTFPPQIVDILLHTICKNRTTTKPREKKGNFKFQGMNTFMYNDLLDATHTHTHKLHFRQNL